MTIRVGHGFDVHRYGPGDSIVLGGVRIAFDRGVVAHSDGDVLLHAICDALLGALGAGDIGDRFPDSDPAYADADSRGLLRDVVALVRTSGWQVSNVDGTVIAQAPRIASFRDQIRANLAADLEVDPEAVNIKATTTERLGYLGREEGIAAHAVALIARHSSQVP